MKDPDKVRKDAVKSVMEKLTQQHLENNTKKNIKKEKKSNSEDREIKKIKKSSIQKKKSVSTRIKPIDYDDASVPMAGYLKFENEEDCRKHFLNKLSSLSRYKVLIEAAVDSMIKEKNKSKKIVVIHATGFGYMYELLIAGVLGVLSRQPEVVNANEGKPVQYFPKFDLEVIYPRKPHKFIECKLTKGNQIGSYLTTTIEKHIQKKEPDYKFKHSEKNYEKLITDCVLTDKGDQYLSKNGVFFRFPSVYENFKVRSIESGKRVEVSAASTGLTKVSPSSLIVESSKEFNNSLNEKFEPTMVKSTGKEMPSVLTIINDSKGKNLVSKINSTCLSIHKSFSNNQKMALTASVERYLGDFLIEVKDK